MSRTRRMSLRARMLVMLVGVTTILLLIMGTVSTYLFVRRVDAQIALASKNLITQAAGLQLQQQPAAFRQDVEALPANDAVVGIPAHGPFAAVPLRGGAITAQLALAVDKRLDTGYAAGALEDIAEGKLQAARGLIRAWHCTGFPYLGCAFTLDGKIRVAGALERPAQAGQPAGNKFAILFVGQPLSTAANQVRGFIVAELITGTALIALLALGGEWLIGRGLTPLDEMTRTANEITSRGDLTARMPDADDQTEVGRLGSSINTMLDRIQHAFGSRLRSEQKVREFAADASHELRTPLTTIRGYAELYRQGALGPDQLPNAMRRIEQEAERMSTLVSELLELARLDRTSSLDLTETDLASVVRDAVADAIAVEPQRPVSAEAPPRLVAVVDEPRIRQVLANLLGNVRAHTPVTTPVAVRLGAITGGVLIEVADAGPGMSTQDAIRAFDRFHRAAERPGTEAADAAAENQDQDGNKAVRASAPGSSTVAGRLNGIVPGGAVGRDAAGGAALNGATLNGATLNGATLNGAGLNGAELNGAAVRRAAVNRTAKHGIAADDGTAAGPGRDRAPVGSGRAERERTSGSGLGLSIVQAIANAHGGRATLESLPGQGTKVRVWLPVRTVP